MIFVKYSLRGFVSNNPYLLNIGSLNNPHVYHTFSLLIVDHICFKYSLAFNSSPYSKNERAPAFNPPADIPVIISYATSYGGNYSTN